MVLVVDDDASVRKALRRLFHATGRNVETFASAAEFLAYDLPPDAGCLVLDIRARHQWARISQPAPN